MDAENDRSENSGYAICRHTATGGHRYINAETPKYLMEINTQTNFITMILTKIWGGNDYNRLTSKGKKLEKVTT